MTAFPARRLPTHAPVSAPPETHEDIRTWLQLVKTVLPMEREANRLFQHEFGQSLPRFDALAQLERALPGGLPVGVLADQLIASAGNITRLVSRMADEGLVVRQAADGDRRSQIVVITDKGLEIYRAMADRHTEWAVERMGVLSDPEKATLRTILAKLRQAPGAERRAPPRPFAAAGDGKA